MSRFPSPTTNGNLCRKAANGAEFLDMKLPGWHRKIDRATLDVRNIGCCVMAQLFGCYEKACAKFELTMCGRARLGFTLWRVEKNERAEEQSWRTLTAAWKREVNARLAQDARAVITPAKEIAIPKRRWVTRQLVAARS